MLQTVKRRLYFFVARYFLFWAKLQLLIWRPQVIIVTGSSGKTTTMHLLEAQLGDRAHYSHHANSAFGISFDILDMSRKTLLKSEWPKLFLKAPLRAFRKPYAEKIYIAEVDCDRPKEGKMVARFLKPRGVIWLSSGKTHSMNFESEVQAGKFKNVETAIAHAFSEVARTAKSFIITNKDNKLMSEQLGGVKADVEYISMKQCQAYQPSEKGTVFKTKQTEYVLSKLVPQEVFYSLEAAGLVCGQLGFELDPTFAKFELPPGRSSLFKGVKKTTIIDSSYNSSADAFAAMMHMFQVFDAQKKWLVAGDILEQGSNEAAIHKNMANVIQKSGVQQVVLVGPRLITHTKPELLKLKFPEKNLASFEQPHDALDYIQANLVGGETVLFKGARFLEGIIEHLLADKADIEKLCRRELIWQQRRKKWGL